MTSTLLTLGPLVYSPLLGMDTPTYITVPEGLTFDWSDEAGMYVGRDGQPDVFLYVEGEVLTPESYYELMKS